MNRTFAVCGLSILLGAGALGLPACNSNQVRTEPVATTMLNPESTPLASDTAGTAGQAKKHAVKHVRRIYTAEAPTATAIATPTVEALSTPTPAPAPTPASKPCGSGLIWVLLLLVLLLVGGWIWAKMKEKNEDLQPPSDNRFGTPPPPPPPPPSGKGGTSERDVLAPKDSGKKNPSR
jgi:hypothetical protein